MVVVEQSVNVALAIADRAVFMERGHVRFEDRHRTCSNGATSSVRCSSRAREHERGEGEGYTAAKRCSRSRSPSRSSSTVWSSGWSTASSRSASSSCSARRASSTSRRASSAFGATLMAVLYVNEGLPFWVTVPLAIASGAVIGALTELLVVRRLFHQPRLLLFVATVGIAQVILLVQLQLPIIDTNLAFPTPWTDIYTVNDRTTPAPTMEIAEWHRKVESPSDPMRHRHPWDQEDRRACGEGDDAEASASRRSPRAQTVGHRPPIAQPPDPGYVGSQRDLDPEPRPFASKKRSYPWTWISASTSDGTQIDTGSPTANVKRPGPDTSPALMVTWRSPDRWWWSRRGFDDFATVVVVVVVATVVVVEGTVEDAVVVAASPPPHALTNTRAPVRIVILMRIGGTLDLVALQSRDSRHRVTTRRTHLCPEDGRPGGEGRLR